MSTLIYIKYGTEENTKSRASSTSGYQEYQEDQDQNIGATYISDVVFLLMLVQIWGNTMQYNALFVIEMHQDMPISLFKTPFDHFHFRPFSGMKLWH